MLPIIVHFLSLVMESRGGTRMWDGWYTSCSGPAYPEELLWELRTLLNSPGAMTLWSESQERQLPPVSPCYCLLNPYLLKPRPCTEQNLHFEAVQKHLEMICGTAPAFLRWLIPKATSKGRWEKDLSTEHPVRCSFPGLSHLQAPAPWHQLGAQKFLWHERQASPCPWAQEDVWSPATHQPSPHLCLSPSVQGDSSDSTGRGC